MQADPLGWYQQMVEEIRQQYRNPEFTASNDASEQEAIDGLTEAMETFLIGRHGMAYYAEPLEEAIYERTLDDLAQFERALMHQDQEPRQNMWRLKLSDEAETLYNFLSMQDQVVRGEREQAPDISRYLGESFPLEAAMDELRYWGAVRESISVRLSSLPIANDKARLG